MSRNAKKRIICASAALLIILLGLLSRKISWIPSGVGDALWSMVVFLCWRIILIKYPVWLTSVAALVTSFAVEFSQLLNFEWLKAVRSTFIGHMLLGQGFLWSDLLSYTIGVALMTLIAYIINTAVNRRAG